MVESVAPEELKPRRTLTRRMAIGALSGLGMSLAFVIMLVINSYLGTSGGSSTSWMPDRWKDRPLRGFLYYALAFIGLICICFGGGFAGHAILGTDVGAVFGALIAYFTAWTVAGIIWGATSDK